jgi:hypothetical protein
MADRELRKKLRRKAKKQQKRKLGDAIEDNGHHTHEKKSKSKG